MTDDELKAEVLRRGLLVGVEANDPHDGYYAFEFDPANMATGELAEVAQPMVWRSDVKAWRLCDEVGCDEPMTTGAFIAHVGWRWFCEPHRKHVTYDGEFQRAPRGAVTQVSP